MTGSPATRADRTQLVTFRVGDEVFAAEIFAVERVLRFVEPRPIPNVPTWLEGVMDYSGRVVPVIDLRTRFEMPAAKSRDGARILVVVVAPDEWVAAIVDSVEEIVSAAPDRFAPPPAIFRGLAKMYLKALVRPDADGAPMMVLLDMANLLTARERIVLDQAVSAAANRD